MYYGAYVLIFIGKL